eukprot:122591-Pelagomonas_calceolata.AAC.1
MASLHILCTANRAILMGIRRKACCVMRYTQCIETMRKPDVVAEQGPRRGSNWLASWEPFLYACASLRSA